jgi:hypothetical protein
MTDKEVSIRTDDLDEKSKERLQQALQQAGLKLKEASGIAVKAAEVGTIETTIELETGGLDETKINDLRNVGFSSERHSAALDTVLRGALPGYGTAQASEDFVQWLWCQWQQFKQIEKFTKRYEVRPSAAAPGAAASSGGGGW